MSSTISAGIDSAITSSAWLSVLRRARRVAGVVQQQLDDLDHVLVVVDHEHVVAGLHACAPASAGRWIQLVRSESAVLLGQRAAVLLGDRLRDRAPDPDVVVQRRTCFDLDRSRAKV
jgi:hypothetical protein